MVHFFVKSKKIAMDTVGLFLIAGLKYYNSFIYKRTTTFHLKLESSGPQSKNDNDDFCCHAISILNYVKHIKNCKY